MRTLELIDWAERHPEENAQQIAIRQSTFCPCGKPKQIGESTCGHGRKGAAPELKESQPTRKGINDIWRTRS